MTIKTDLEQGILKVLHYFDLFNFPLTRAEIYHFIRLECTPEELEEGLQQLLLEQKIFCIEDCYLLHHAEHLVARKKKGFKQAQKELKKAQKIAQLIHTFPFVRMVAVSGSLSKGYADEHSDIDFFIVTSTHNLWTARSILHLFKKLTFLVNMQDSFCMNYFIADQHLEIEEQNYFTAIELNTLIPLTGIHYYNQLLKANSWTKKYLPNKCVHVPKTVPQAPKNIKLFLEKLLPSKKLNHFFMRITDKRWQKKWQKRGVSQEVYQLAFKTNLYVSKNHPTNNQKNILEQYSKGKQQPQKKHMLILGGTGFIGQYFCQQLARLVPKEVHLHFLIRHPKQQQLLDFPNATFYHGDLKTFNWNTLSHLPNYIFHFARLNASRGKKWGRKWAAWQGKKANNRLLYFLHSKKAKTQLFYLSGSLMYGNHAHSITEQTALNPVSFAKEYITAELPFLQAQKEVNNLKITLVRVPWVLGNGSWFAAFFKAYIEQHQQVPLYGTGDNTMSFITAQDLATCLLKLPSLPYKEVLNLAYPTAMLQKDFVQLIAQKLQLPIQAIPLKTSFEPAIIEAFESNIQLNSNYTYFDAILKQENLQDILEEALDLLFHNIQ